MTAVYAEPVSNSAYLCLQSNQDIAWRPVSAGVTPTVVSGNGTYQVTYQMQHDANLLVALVLSTDINAYSYAPSTAQASTILQDTSVRIDYGNGTGNKSRFFLDVHWAKSSCFWTER